MPPRSDQVRIFQEAPVLAFAGARRSGKGFGSERLRELVRQGYRVAPIHPAAKQLQGRPAL